MTTKKTRTEAAGIARQVWAVKPGQTAVRGSMRIPDSLLAAFEEQNSNDRGSTWVDGYFVNEQIVVLHQVLCKLSGREVSFIVDKDITLLVGDNAFTSCSHLIATMKAIVFYLQDNPEASDRWDLALEATLKGTISQDDS